MRRLNLLLVMLILPAVAAAGDAPESPILVLDAGGHTAMVRKVLFTPDGRELITVSDDKTIRVWDVASGEPLRMLRPPIGRGSEGMLFAAALSPDGRTLAVEGYGNPADHCGQIFLIALTNGRIERVLKGHTNVIHALAFAPDGRRLASGSGDHTARIWDVGSGRCEQVLQGHINYIYGVAFAPDGRRLATASYDTTGRIWSVADGRCEQVLRGHAKEVHCVAWRPDGQVVATGGYDRSIRLWGPDGRSFPGFDGLENHIISLTFTADSRELLFTWGSGEKNMRGATLLDLTTGRERVRFAQHTNTVIAGALARRHAGGHGRRLGRDLSLEDGRRYARAPPGQQGARVSERRLEPGRTDHRLGQHQCGQSPESRQSPRTRLPPLGPRIR